MNRRFWLWYKESWVKVTIGQGQSITLTGGGRTDEGHHWWADCYKWQSDGVTCDNHSESTDCDGRYSGSSEYIWHGELTEAHDGTWIPKWNRVTEQHRDYSAEAMNY